MGVSETASKRLGALILCFALAAAERPAASGAALPVDLELVLAVDVSGSIDEDEAKLQRQGYLAALVDARLMRAIRSGQYGRIAVAYVEWADAYYQRTVVDWTLIFDEKSARAFAARLAAAPLTSAPWTSISGAIDYGAKLFAGNGYEGIRRVIDISGDGRNNRGRPVTAARDEAVARGITINGLPIVNDRLNPWGGPPDPEIDLYYERHVIGGPGAFVIAAKNFDAFAAAILSKLIMEIAGTTPRESRAASSPSARHTPGGTNLLRSPGRLPAAGKTFLGIAAAEARLRRHVIDKGGIP